MNTNVISQFYNSKNELKKIAECNSKYLINLIHNLRRDYKIASECIQNETNNQGLMEYYSRKSATNLDSMVFVLGYIYDLGEAIRDELHKRNIFNF